MTVQYPQKTEILPMKERKTQNSKFTHGHTYIHTQRQDMFGRIALRFFLI